MEQWLISVAAKKVGWGIAKSIAGILLAPKVAAYLQSVGITLDPSLVQTALPASLFGVFHALHDWLKLKTGSPYL